MQVEQAADADPRWRSQALLPEYLCLTQHYAFGDSIPKEPRQIIGGRDTDSREFPTVLYVGGCTGSLIAPQWALTAAHCVIGKQPVGGVQVERGYPEDYESRRSVQVIVHPEYVNHPNSSQNDIALVRFDRPFYSKTVRIQKLVDQSLQEVLLLPGTMTTSVGWGQTGRNRNASVLQTAQWPIASCPTTDQFEEFVLLDELFCCPNTPWISQTYLGDSGGPVLVDHQGILWQIGVHTYKANARVNGRYEYHAIALNVVPYREWIESETRMSVPPDNTEIEEEFLRLNRRLREAQDILSDTIDGLARLRVRVRDSAEEAR